MVTFPSRIFNQLCLKNTHSIPRNERTHYFKKKASKIINMSTFFWLPTSWSCTRITLKSYRSKLYESFKIISRNFLHGELLKYKFPDPGVFISKFHENSKISSFFQHFGEEAAGLFDQGLTDYES